MWSFDAANFSAAERFGTSRRPPPPLLLLLLLPFCIKQYEPLNITLLKELNIYTGYLHRQLEPKRMLMELRCWHEPHLSGTDEGDETSDC